MEGMPDDFLKDLKKQFQMIKENSNDKEVREKALQNSASKIDEVLSKIKTESPDYLRVLSMKASILYENAKISLTINQFQKAKEYLENSLNLIKDHAENDQIAFLYLRVVNYLAYILSRLGKLEIAQSLLEKVIDKGITSNPKVYSTEDLFSDTKTDENIGKLKIDKLMINNMQMLGWVYGKVGLKELYAEMQHKCLQKELDLNDGDPVQWAMKCYRLASLLLTECKWVLARYHLAAAQAVLDPLEVGFTPNPLIYRAQAELARVWVNYGLHLFSISKKACLERRLNDESDIIDLEKSPQTKEDVGNSTFNDLEVSVPNVPVTEILNIQEAKSLFTNTHKWIKRARLYYTLRDYPIQYVNIVLELSELYRLLAFYEVDVDSAYNLQKKRYDTLETLSGILKEVRPNCYAAVSVELIREIIDVQIELMNLNLKKLYNPDRETNLNESDIKRRVDTLNDIHAKMENLGEDTQFTSEAGDIDITSDQIMDKDEADVKLNESINENKGEGEIKIEELSA
ncbi:KIF1-binding protein-like [Anoplophora glabripennis]|uniref:KIF1-binding protein-like n=1 Tax=Anoplophora glabripennis TaxID=217634 RepID=UPI00087502FD|nr:KIF1-binding protein-like [Anoplophora glabripennis]